MNGEPNMQKVTFYSFADVVQSIDKIVKRIDDYKYDYVVGIVRGGLVPATMLSHRLGIPLHTMKWSTRDHQEKEHVGWIAEDVKAGKNILIVDDLIDSGLCIQEIVADWGINRHDVDIAVISQNIKAPVIANHYDTTFDSDDNIWYVWPWEVYKPVA